MMRIFRFFHIILIFVFFLSNSSPYLFTFQNRLHFTPLDEMPIYFVKNNGEFDGKIKFHGIWNGVFFSEDGVYLTLRNKDGKHPAEVVKIVPLNNNRKFEIKGEEEGHGKVNYFIGNEPEKWKNELSIFKKIRYKEVFPNVDIVFYGKSGHLEYDILVKPGADISKISFEICGTKELSLNDGSIVVKLSSGNTIFQKKPYIYQEINGKRFEIDGSYRIKKENGKFIFSFHIKSFNNSYPLIIDPTLIYSTYLGGSYYDGGYGIAVDNSGSVYLIGQTFSSDFPVSSPIKGKSGYYDVFVTKINPEGNSLVYSTFLGGDGDDYGYAIAVDSSGNAYITGYTESKDFPTKSPIQNRNYGGRDVFVAKINPEGNSLVYSTYLGGSNNDYGYKIAVDVSGSAYLVGTTYSTDFPSKNPIYGYSGYYDVFITKINPEGNSLVYSSYFGGSNTDYGYGLAVDSSGNVYITGATYSSDFPLKNPIKGRAGLWDAFMVKINQEGGVVLSTYLGGSDNDYGTGIVVDSLENVYLTGYTSSPDFPTQNPIQESISGDYDLFITKISTRENNIVYSTFLGGRSSDYGRGIAIDSKGNIYITGETYSSNFPTQNPLQISNGGYWDVFISKINTDGSAIVYSTYLGGSSNDYSNGIAVDSLGNAYITGYTSSSNFPTAVPLYGYSNGYDAFVAKIEEGLIKYILTVTKTGTGTGVVTTDDGGINCGEDCSEEYDAGINVTLTAMPDPDSTFTGWSGDCSGTEQKIVVKIDSNKNCVANFEKASLPDLIGEWKNVQIFHRVSGVKLINAIFRIRNKGTAECSDEFKVSIYYSNDGTTLDYLLKTITISRTININEYRDFIFSYYFASYVSLSGKFIIGVIDPENSLKERDKTNNRFSYGPIE